MPQRIVARIAAVAEGERAPGLALAAATAVALVWANVAARSEEDGCAKGSAPPVKLLSLLL